MTGWIILKKSTVRVLTKLRSLSIFTFIRLPVWIQKIIKDPDFAIDYYGEHIFASITSTVRDRVILSNLLTHRVME